MKHLIKTVFGLSIAALLTVFISCPQPAGPGGGNSGTVTPVPKTPVEKALGELTVRPVQVYNGMDKVDLPITTSIAGVTITWTAEPADYIKTEDPDRGKILKRETEETEVTLTAKATDGSETKTKDFTITIHPATVDPDAQALASSLSCPVSVSQDFILQKSVDGYPTAVITWESADDKIIKIETVGTELKGIVGYDLIDRTVKLTATVHYNSGTGTKDFNVTVDRVSEIKEEYNQTDSEGNSFTVIEKHEFTGTELVITYTKKDDNVLQRGVKYTYTDVRTAPDGTKTAVFTKTVEYNKDKKKWMTKTEKIQEIQQYLDRIKSELEKLKKKNSLTLLDFKTLPPLAYVSTREKMFEALKWFPDENNPLKAYTFETFNALNDEQESDELKKMLPIIENFIAQNIDIQEGIALVEQEFKPSKYRYEFYKSGVPDTDIQFRAVVFYDSGKPWYEQKGSYNFQNTSAPHPAPAGTIMFIYFRVNKSGSNTYSAYIAVHKADGSGNSVNYYNKKGIPYTPGSPIAATLWEKGNTSSTALPVEITNIYVAGDGTMTANVKIDTGSPQHLTLQFEGQSL